MARPMLTFVSSWKLSTPPLVLFVGAGRELRRLCSRERSQVQWRAPAPQGPVGACLRCPAAASRNGRRGGPVRRPTTQGGDHHLTVTTRPTASAAWLSADSSPRRRCCSMRFAWSCCWRCLSPAQRGNGGGTSVVSWVARQRSWCGTPALGRLSHLPPEAEVGGSNPPGRVPESQLSRERLICGN
jgi:hypothetical protein